MSEQRTRVLQIRMTPAEHDRVTAEAEAVGMKASALGRERILSPNPPIISAREVDGGQPVTGGRVIYDEATPASASPTRQCRSCKALVGSPTMRRHSCGGEIIPPPPKGKA